MSPLTHNPADWPVQPPADWSFPSYAWTYWRTYGVLPDEVLEEQARYQASLSPWQQRNARHRQMHPDEKQSGLHYGIIVAIVTGVIVFIPFIAILMSQVHGSAVLPFVLLFIIGVPLFGAWAVLARRHPVAAWSIVGGVAAYGHHSHNQVEQRGEQLRQQIAYNNTPQQQQQVAVVPVLSGIDMDRAYQAQQQQMAMHAAWERENYRLYGSPNP